MLCDKDFIHHLVLMQLNAPEAAQHLRNLLEKFHRMKAISAIAVEKNAYLEGRIMKQSKLKPNESRTFAEATKCNVSQAPQKGSKETSHERRATILVRSPEQEQDEASSAKVKATLAKNLKPSDAHLKGCWPQANQRSSGHCHLSNGH